MPSVVPAQAMPPFEKTEKTPIPPDVLFIVEGNMKLLEWDAKKVTRMIRKLMLILTRKTGERYTLVAIPDAYKNVWGKFIGYFIISSKNKVFRLNFRMEKMNQAEIVSVDRFPDGSTGEGRPITTLSLEGYGIGKVFFSLVDFLKVQNAQATLQMIEADATAPIREDVWTPQVLQVNGKTNRLGYAATYRCRGNQKIGRGLFREYRGRQYALHGLHRKVGRTYV